VWISDRDQRKLIKMRPLLVLAACLALASCVSAPKGPPTISGAEQRGHALEPTDTVVVHVSNLWAPAGKVAAADPNSKTHRTIEPAKDLEALRKAFMAGFNSVKPGSRILLADQRIGAACFSAAGLAKVEPWIEPVRPNFEAPECQEALQATRVRYLVSAQAWLATESGTGVESLGMGVAVSEKIRYHFEAAAAVYDVASGLRICGDRGWQDPEPVSRGAGFVIIPSPIPVPLPLAIYETVDAKAYWEHAAWQAGARIGNCFVAPTQTEDNVASGADTCSGVSNAVGAVDAVAAAPRKPNATRLCLIDPLDCPVRCDYTSYNSCVDAKPDRRYGCVPWKEGFAFLRPYAWPVRQALPIVVRPAPLVEFVPLRSGPDSGKGTDCVAELSAEVESALAPLRMELEEVAAAAQVEEMLRGLLAADRINVEGVRWVSSARGRVDDLQAIGARAGTRSVIVADVQVRFGQLNQAQCVVKLIASVAVRVQPIDLPESAAPLFRVLAAVDEVAVKAWARSPATARKELDLLLKQVAADLARSYREWSFGAP
jgi:hypothetical protein